MASQEDIFTQAADELHNAAEDAKRHAAHAAAARGIESVEHHYRQGRAEAFEEAYQMLEHIYDAAQKASKTEKAKG